MDYRNGGDKMKLKKMTNYFAIVLAVSAVFIVTDYSVSSADECRMVKINSMATWYEYKLGLEPKTIRINKGTCLTWYNRSITNVRLLFEDGKDCVDVIDAASEFMIDGNACLISKTHILHGDTASLVFKKKGSYKYYIELDGGKDKLQGRVFVR
jgi:plastocyanin